MALQAEYKLYPPHLNGFKVEEHCFLPKHRIMVIPSESKILVSDMYEFNFMSLNYDEAIYFSIETEKSRLKWFVNNRAAVLKKEFEPYEPVVIHSNSQMDEYLKTGTTQMHELRKSMNQYGNI